MEADRRQPYSQWTVDTLYEHLCEVFKLYQKGVDERFRAMDEATQQALDSSTKAVDKTERLADVRAEVQDRLAAERSRQQNEWRETINDIGARMVSKDEYNTAHQVLVERLERMQAHVDRTGGTSAGVSSAIGWLLAGIGGVVAVVTILLEVTATH